MLKFNEIKQDHKNGYTFMDYESSWYGKDVYMVLEDNTLLVCISWEYMENIDDYQYNCTFEISMNEFMNMKYKDFISYIKKQLYYNTVIN